MKILVLLFLSQCLTGCHLVIANSRATESEVIVQSGTIESSKNPVIRLGVLSSNPFFFYNAENRLFDHPIFHNRNTIYENLSDLGVIYLKKFLLATDGVSVFNTNDANKIDYFIRFNCTEFSSTRKGNENYKINFIRDQDTLFGIIDLKYDQTETKAKTKKEPPKSDIEDEFGIEDLLFIPPLLVVFLADFFIKTYSEAFSDIFYFITGLPPGSYNQNNSFSFKYDLQLFDSSGILNFSKSYYVTIFSKISIKGEFDDDLFAGSGTFLASTAVDGLQELMPEIMIDVHSFIKNGE